MKQEGSGQKANKRRRWGGIQENNATKRLFHRQAFGEDSSSDLLMGLADELSIPQASLNESSR